MGSIHNARQLQGLIDAFSKSEKSDLSITIGGVGKNAHVNIIKGSGIVTRKMMEYENNKRERERLQKYLEVIYILLYVIGYELIFILPALNDVIKSLANSTLTLVTKRLLRCTSMAKYNLEICQRGRSSKKTKKDKQSELNMTMILRLWTGT